MLLSFVSTTFRVFLKLGQKYKNIFVHFLVQMKTLKFAFEIYWPLVQCKEEIRFNSWPFQMIFEHKQAHELTLHIILHFGKKPFVNIKGTKKKGTHYTLIKASFVDILERTWHVLLKSQLKWKQNSMVF